MRLLHWWNPPSELKPGSTSLGSLLSATHNQYTKKRQTTVSTETKAGSTIPTQTSALVEASQLNVIHTVRHCSQDRDTTNNPARLLFLSPHSSSPRSIYFRSKYSPFQSLFLGVLSSQAAAPSPHAPSLLCAPFRSQFAGLAFAEHAAT